MLHMLVSSHNPESCALRGEAEAAALTEALRKLQEGGRGQGISLRGGWVNRPAHEAFFLVDAPNVHVIEDALVEYGLVGRTHTRVLAVVELGEFLDEMRDRETAASTPA